ncbi:transposase family protein [Streptomyces flavochromogenes]|uniref:Transposase family protein n=1 Tax=Streptomyces flavochromogenes TaxID=68199 RepID=A0ABW6Y3J3_9ACTN
MCPSCGCSSSRIHSSYLRLTADVPSAGRRVVLCLRIRSFFCVRTANVRRADTGADQEIPVDRTSSVDPGHGRPRPRRPGRRPDAEPLRSVCQPQYGAAAGRHAARAGRACPAGGGRR